MVFLRATHFVRRAAFRAATPQVHARFAGDKTNHVAWKCASVSRFHLGLQTRTLNTKSSDELDTWEWIPPVQKNKTTGGLMEGLVDEVEEGFSDDYVMDQDEVDKIIPGEMTDEELEQLNTWTVDELEDRPILQISETGGKIRGEEFVQALKGNAARDVSLLDLTDKVDFVEEMVLCTARSRTHMRKLAKIVYQGAKRRGQDPMNDRIPIEGLESDEWMLVDLGYLMVHVFSEEGRAHYDVEGYWKDEFDAVAYYASKHDDAEGDVLDWESLEVDEENLREMMSGLSDEDLAKLQAWEDQDEANAKSKGRSGTNTSSE